MSRVAHNFPSVILLPHIADFVMFMYLKMNGKPFVKFGELRKDGTLKVPNPIKMKFLLPYYFNTVTLIVSV